MKVLIPIIDFWYSYLEYNVNVDVECSNCDNTLSFDIDDCDYGKDRIIKCSKCKKKFQFILEIKSYLKEINNE